MIDRRHEIVTLAILALAVAAIGARAQTPTPPIDCARIAGLLGRPAPAEDGTTCRITFPRGHLSVELLGAGLHDNGLRITAIHRHMIGENPLTSFVHYLGIGSPDSLAVGLRAALDRAGRPFAGPGGPAGGEAGVVAGTSCESIAEVLGVDPAAADRGPGYCKVSRPRDDLSVTVDGIAVPASMGIGSWFAFRESPDGEAAVIAGDMALLEDDLDPAIAALRAEGIEVVALHNHMLLDEPTVYFFHFQARGAPLELARGLRTGLEAARLAP